MHVAGRQVEGWWTSGFADANSLIGARNLNALEANQNFAIVR